MFMHFLEIFNFKSKVFKGRNKPLFNLRSEKYEFTDKLLKCQRNTTKTSESRGIKEFNQQILKAERSCVFLSL